MHKYNNLVEYQRIFPFLTLFQKQGKGYALTVFENFLHYLKLKTFCDPVEHFLVLFFSQYELPFKLHVITFSNRNYYFPGPFRTPEEYHKFLIKKLGIIIKKRKENTFQNKIFGELLAYITQGENSISYLRDILEQLFLQGLENRAYIHYRWLLNRE